MSTNIWSSNTPQRFWSCQPDPDKDLWDEAVRRAAGTLKFSEKVKNLDTLLEYTLGEAQFGKDRYKMGVVARLYYRVKPFVPRAALASLRRLYNSTKNGSFALGWPLETRFAEFQWKVLQQVMLLSNQREINFTYFWPTRKRFAFVLTHDIETARGQSLVPVLADMEEELGFRSIFNFVPELYPLDRELIRDLKNRGFEVGVHGLKHDGKLFDHYRQFSQRAERINHYLTNFSARGFRAPLTIRNPEWMQILNIEYDLSFFDTDPYEPMAGGVMTMWPFQVGRFIELPYTLPQDSTLFNILGETSPRVWLDKLEWIKKYHAMALVIVHPDYSAEGKAKQIYYDFLVRVRECADYWHALPQDVAFWWKQRMDRTLNDVFPTGLVAQARLMGDTLEILYAG